MTCLGFEIQSLGLWTWLETWERRLETYLWLANQWLCPTSADHPKTRIYNMEPPSRSKLPNCQSELLNKSICDIFWTFIWCPFSALSRLVSVVVCEMTPLHRWLMLWTPRGALPGRCDGQSAVWRQWTVSVWFNRPAEGRTAAYLTTCNSRHVGVHGNYTYLHKKQLFW